jgi:hypothetical protein
LKIGEGLERVRAGGRRLRVRVTGVLAIVGDVTPALAVEAIAAVELRGAPSRAVWRALAGASLDRDQALRDGHSNVIVTSCQNVRVL